MLEVYTSQYRYNGPDRLDITVKSGKKAFAPSWEIVMGVKNGTMTQQQYIVKYNEMMNKSMANNSKIWQELLSRNRVVLVCFCPKGAFCHRVLLAKILEMRGAKYLGEI